MIIVPIIYHNDGYDDNTIDYTAMEREFRKEMNLLLDAEIKSQEP